MTDIAIERACERLVMDFACFSDQQDYESLGAVVSFLNSDQPSPITNLEHQCTDIIVECIRMFQIGDRAMADR
jgi:hypothetical protein